jgi:hypothetical protein
MNFYLDKIKSNFLKFKVYAMFRFLIDKDYRRDIRIIKKMSEVPYVYKNVRVEISELVAGHSVNYPRWVKKLVKQLLDGKHPPHMEVMYHDRLKKYVVLDGNHRLPAFREVFGLNKKVHVKLRVPTPRVEFR